MSDKKTGKEANPKKKEAKPKEPKEKKETKKPVEGEKKRFSFNPNYEKFMPEAKVDFETLKTDIQKKGLLEPIITLEDGTVIDGHNRIRACEALGLEIPEEMVRTIKLPPDKIIDFMFSKNVARRHLTDFQKYALIEKYLPEMEVRKREASKKRGAAATEALRREVAGAETEEDATRKKEKEKRKASGKKGGPAGPTSATRKKLADKAGISTAAVREIEFIKRYAPDLYEEAKKKDTKVRPLYERVNEWFQTVKENDKELFELVKKGEMKLQDAFDEVIKNKPEVATEPPKPGPIQKALEEGRGIIEKWIKKAHEDEFLPDAREMDLIQKYDALISKYLGR